MTVSVIGHRLWLFLSSVRLALVLILIVTGLSLTGALLAQAPSEVTADPVKYALWLEHVARPGLGTWTSLLSFLGLFNVFSSPLFSAAGILLVANILVCSLNRWRRLSGTAGGDRVRRTESFYRSGTCAGFPRLPLSPPDTVSRLRQVLRKRCYRVRVAEEHGVLYLAAEKNRYSFLGTYLSHLSLILLIMGFLIGNYFGFRNTSFIVPEGTTREVGHGTGLSLHLDSFVDEYWPEGAPKDYRSEVVIYKDGNEVKRGTVRVNHPVSYEGIRFYQSFFGPAAIIRVCTDSGLVLFEDNVALSEFLAGTVFKRYIGKLSLPEYGLEAYLVSPATDTLDPIIEKEELGLEIYQGSTRLMLDKLRLEVPKKAAGLEFTYLLRAKYSGFQVSRDPGSALVWVAAIFFVIGISVAFYLPRRQLWIMVQPVDQETSCLLVRSASGRTNRPASELQQVTETIQTWLSKLEQS